MENKGKASYTVDIDSLKELNADKQQEVRRYGILSIFLLKRGTIEKTP